MNDIISHQVMHTNFEDQIKTEDKTLCSSIDIPKNAKISLSTDVQNETMPESSVDTVTTSTDTEQENLSLELHVETVVSLQPNDEPEVTPLFVFKEPEKPLTAYQSEQVLIADDEGKKRKGLLHHPVKLAPLTYPKGVSFEGACTDEPIVVPMTRTEYEQRYQSAEKKCALQILNMCRVVYEANKTLDSAQFVAFCETIGYKDYSSVIRKFIIIGKLQPRLIDFAHLLPSSWSSIYQLTQIPAQYFETMLRINRSFKDMTVKEIKNAVKDMRDVYNLDNIFKSTLITEEEKNGKVLNANIAAKVYMTKIPDDLDWHAFQKAMREIEANLPVRIVVNGTLRDLFSERKDIRYEKIKQKKANDPFIPENWDLGRKVSTMQAVVLPTSQNE